MKYLFFVNVERDTQGRNVGFFGYDAGHALELAYSGELDAASDAAALEGLFEQFNIHHPVSYSNRSMSVGDVVVLCDGEGRRAYACEPVNWKKVSLPLLFATLEVTRLKGEGWTQADFAEALKDLLDEPHT